MVGYIYKAVVADKVYIGKTIGKFEARVKTHINLAFVQKKNTPIGIALRTLSEEDAYNAFSMIETVYDDDYESLERTLCECENFYMNLFNSMVPNGYNVVRSSPQKRRSVSTQPPRESVMREVICVETGESFKSMADAARWANVNISAVYHCLKGVNNTAGGKHWRYADGEYHECKRPEGRKNKKSQSKPVICKETGVIYPSVGEASRQTGITSSNIAKCANGKMHTAKGYHWGFVIDGVPVYKETQNLTNVRIKCVETGVEYDSIASCAREIGDATYGGLQSSIKRGHKHKGFTYIRI